MAINQENINFLFDIIKFYDEQYNKIADNCYEEVYRELSEICSSRLGKQDIDVLPYGVYALKNNYQVLEPMEFYCILPQSRDILEKEREQKLNFRKRKNNTKSIYAEITGGSRENAMTSIDVAKIIMQEMERYVGQEDKIYFKNNVIFIKFHVEEDIYITINIYVVYDFEDDGVLEFSKLGYKFKENSVKMMENIKQKNLRTKGNYLLFCKLLKMLELELVVSNQSKFYLSNKSMFMENVLYNVPDKFFEGTDFCEIFKYVLNYLKQCDIESIVLPDDQNTQMFKNNWYYANSFFISLLKKMTYLYNNTDTLIKEALEIREQSKQEDNSSVNTEQNKNQDDNKVRKINIKPKE